ncbi:hypothetical protein C8A05DRAFT_48012 [Staphylotrichum tortipilum]|uniref:Uncharacterized protein n=1 Tax=Staphylotrichum tortipilum TaxID=2831512 RepID=A0AAN6MBG5_9PEZI|nr:hypothetical protein C8A05DRAFT_48012 [Staphylotrichum longicolle]
MTHVSQLEASVAELTAATRQFSELCPTAHRSTTPYEVSPEAWRLQRTAFASLAKIQRALAGPDDLLQTLTVQTQLLACLQWLGEFQVLACIPLNDSVSVQDVADLAGVPEPELIRMIRMTATAGFLEELQPGWVHHTALSALFVTRPGYLDAVMFLAGTIMPAALKMPMATYRLEDMGMTHQAAYNVASNSPISFASDCDRLPKLQRQWAAYVQYGTGDMLDRATDMLTCLEPLAGSTAKVVETGARSTKRAAVLASQYPSLHFVVQMSRAAFKPSSRRGPNPWNGGVAAAVPTQEREPGMQQPVTDAAVYLVHLPALVPAAAAAASLRTVVVKELRAHLGVLRADPTALLVLLPHFVLPDLAGAEEDQRDEEPHARARDLSLLQLANEKGLELSELLKLVAGVGDGAGHLVIIRRVRGPFSGALAIEVRYQAY